MPEQRAPDSPSATGTRELSEAGRRSALLKAGALQNAILNSANFSIIATDEKGVIQIFNVGAEHMLGYRADEVINRVSPSDLHDPMEVTARAVALTTELATPIAPGFEALAFKASRGIEDIYELTYIRKDGSRFPAIVSITALRDDHETLIGYLLIGTDNSARKLVEQQLNEAVAAAEKANLAKSDFLSSMSHELRTPMNAVLGFGQLMEYDDTLPAEHLDSVREILKAGHHLLELINEVLDLVKVESGQIDLSLEPVEVCPVVAECLDLVGPLAAKRGIQVSQIGLAGAMLRADRTRLKQALLNLLGNAIKYNREGGSVLLDVQTEGDDRLRIRVTDTGPGIPAARLNELFQPFNRLGAENSNTEGTGIGLTITRRIVEMMGGSVDVRSEVGVGSTFWIELPLESAPNPELGQPQREPDEGTPDGAPERHLQMPQQTVLYIEDNPSNIKLVAQILGRRKHIQLLTAHTPELGIELALGHHPELILLDISMPGMDGYQVLEIFKADARLKAIPVVAVTANAMTRDIERGLAAGFNDYLTKPLDVARFHAMVDACLALTGKNNA
ncbi:MAG: ATP-binding protein [Hydrogenophaga sp.]|uniref:hybrid sensor histidine kinase/response regulator n=1 Tax=Hydrogenophaga sp. TaxID=1904254 RepID=UPI0027368733|nr:ATP-binding protein [Hydrogenophaga sp.]MDP3347766.1 ATP-binding protein [Hydrogenophaga sp.]